MAVTRAFIRQSVARMLSDFYQVTADDQGRTTALTDNIVLAREMDFFNGMQVYFSDLTSPNFGLISTVTRSDGPTRTINFEPPIPGGVVAGETVDLYNHKGRGTTVDQYNRAINDAIAIAADNHALVPLTVAGSTAYSYKTPQLQIPAQFASFAYVQFTGRDGRLHNLDARRVSVDLLTRTVTIPGSRGYQWNGLTPTFVGYQRPQMLNADDDTTSIEVEWLFNEVKAQILERMLMSGQPVGPQDRLFLQERTEAGGKRPVIIARAVPNTVKLFD